MTVVAAPQPVSVIDAAPEVVRAVFHTRLEVLLELFELVLGALVLNDLDLQGVIGLRINQISVAVRHGRYFGARPRGP